jgi:hypothetical protein
LKVWNFFSFRSSLKRFTDFKKLYIYISACERFCELRFRNISFYKLVTKWWKNHSERSISATVDLSFCHGMVHRLELAFWRWGTICPNRRDNFLYSKFHVLWIADWRSVHLKIVRRKMKTKNVKIVISIFW